CTLLILVVSNAQGTPGQGNSSGHDQLQRPDAIAGKHYSKSECMQIAHWVTADEKKLKSLTGTEVGNFWYTLDSCRALYFSDRNTMSAAPSIDRLELETAFDWASHEYIERLEFAIQSLPAETQEQAVRTLKEVAEPQKDRPLFMPTPNK